MELFCDTCNNEKTAQYLQLIYLHYTILKYTRQAYPEMAIKHVSTALIYSILPVINQSEAFTASECFCSR